MSDAAAGRTAHAKLQAARARLILDRPFIGALLLHLPMTETARCASIGTDGRRIEFDASYIERLTLRQAQFMLAHQALHCALGHYARRGHRVRRRWDIACDLAVNMLLIDEGMEPPPGALVETRYRGLSAEEIYPLVGERDVRAAFDAHMFDAPASGGSSSGGDELARPGDPREQHAEGESTFAASDDHDWSDAAPHRRQHAGSHEHRAVASTLDDLAQQWQMRLAIAAQQAEQSGRLGASWQRVLGRMLQPALPWSAVLARHVASRARDDYSFQRPARREGAAVLPRLHSVQLELFVVLDTSGSVSEAQLAAFAAEIEAIKGQMRARVTLHACDEQLAPDGPWVFEPCEAIRLPSTIKGGGGTDFRPVFDWVREQMHRPDLLVYFTDAEGEFPSSAPPYPVIWLVKGPAPVPWGERIQLN
ncbi:MAG: hypothetical protein IT390_07385 [Nitrospira sp.]|nr:hypothetical protein [Nitrospira sp.]